MAIDRGEFAVPDAFRSPGGSLSVTEAILRRAATVAFQLLVLVGPAAQRDEP